MRHHSGGERVEREEVGDLGLAVVRLSLNNVAVHNVGPGQEPVLEVSFAEGGSKVKFGQVLEKKSIFITLFKI